MTLIFSSGISCQKKSSWQLFVCMGYYSWLQSLQSLGEGLGLVWLSTVRTPQLGWLGCYRSYCTVNLALDQCSARALWFGLVWTSPLCSPHKTGWYCGCCTVNCGLCPGPVRATPAALLRFGWRLTAGQGDHSQYSEPKSCWKSADVLFFG